MRRRKSKQEPKKIEIASAEDVEKYGQAEDAGASDDRPEGMPEPAPDAEQPMEAAAPTSPEPTEVEKEQETDLQRAERERDEFKDKWLRAKAEGENQARRLRADREEAVKYAIANFVRSLLTVVDDLERTLDASQQHDDAESLSQGVRIVYDHLLKVLSDHNVERVGSVGEAFDPQVHEALTQQPSADHPAGIVLQEIQRGYRLHDRVIRPARVIVSGEPAESVGDDAGKETATDEE